MKQQVFPLKLKLALICQGKFSVFFSMTVNDEIGEGVGFPTMGAVLGYGLWGSLWILC